MTFLPQICHDTINTNSSNFVSLKQNEEVDFSFAEEDVDPSEEVLTLEAHFKPLQQETMKNAQESQSSVSHILPYHRKY